MGIERGGGFSGGWSTAVSKPCDSCKSGAAAVFCSGHSAFLCLSCDAKIHGGDSKLASPSRHERVWICEVCQQAPAAVTCKADAASLCVVCDAVIHSAHPLAQRHERVPVEPFFDSTESMIKSAATLNFLVPACNNNGISDDNVNCSEPAQWLLMNSNLSNSKIMEDQDTDVNFSEIDPFLDFEYQYGTEVKFHQQHNENERVVPAPAMDYPTENCFDMDFSRAKLTSFSYPTPTQSLSQSVSSTSVDFRVVPDGNGNSMSDMTSYSFEKNVNGVVPNVPTTSTTVSNQAAQFCGMDREARVLRYREKRKNRKFEKTIRYASRKAYAETRPRIKGRFAKRNEIETEVDDCVSSVPDLCSVLSPANYFLPCGMI